MAGIVDLIARGQRTWSQTRERPETTAAGDVVVRRVESSIEALNQAAVSLRAWRERVLAASDRVIDRAAAVDVALEKLRAASVAERASLFVPDRAPLWSGGLGSEMRSELPRVPGAILAYARSTGRVHRAANPRPIVVQALLAVLLMFALGRFSARARERPAGGDAASRAARLLERPYATGLLLALLASPVFHPLAPRRFIQLASLLAIFPTARIVVHASERANPAVFAALFVLLLLDRVGLAIAALPALASRDLSAHVWRSGSGWPAGCRVACASTAPRHGGGTRRTWPWRGSRSRSLAEIGGWTNLATLVGRGILAAAIAALYIYAAVIAVNALVAYALASRTFRRSYLVERNTAILQRQAERGLRWLGGRTLALLPGDGARPARAPPPTRSHGCSAPASRSGRCRCRSAASSRSCSPW